ncbi:MAG: hypothetical protein O7F12_00505 [Nitrospirae bacterium]|nr:hypothetical protein [Nitrospirota bacterium]
MRKGLPGKAFRGFGRTRARKGEAKSQNDAKVEAGSSLRKTPYEGV